MPHRPYRAGLLALAAILVSLAFAATALAAPPANDDFADAQHLSSSAHITASGDDREATVEPGEPDPAPGFTTRATVWYDWTAPSGHETTIDVCQASISTGVAVFTGSAVDQLTSVTQGTPDNPCQVSFTPTQGTTYRIGVDGLLGQTGTFALALDQGEALTVVRTGTGSGSVTSNPAGIDCGTTCLHRFDADTQVSLTATPASGSTFAGWSGDCSGTGACQVTMSQARSVTATFTEPPPANDDFANAQVLAGTAHAAASGDDRGATVEPGEPDPAPGSTSRATVWYSWTAPSGDQTTIDVCQADFSDVVAVFTGATVNALTQVTAGSPSNRCQVSFTPTQGTTYRIAVDGLSGQTGTFALMLDQGVPLAVSRAGSGSGSVTSNPAGVFCGTTCQHRFDAGTPVTLTATPGSGSTFTGWSGDCSGTGACQVTMSQARSVTATFTHPRPPNDDFADAQDLGSGAHVTASGDNRGATAEAGETDPFPGFTTRATVWYDWTAPSGDQATVDVCQADFSDGVGVATGSSVGSLTPVAAGTPSNPCQVSFTPTQGTTYRIAVDGLFGHTGTFDLAVDQGVLYGLTVAKSGSGSGTVTSNPEGISCGTNCQHSFVANTEVTLIATAASGSNFAGWSGCSSETATCKVTMTQARSVTAIFTQTTPPPNDAFANAQDLGNGAHATASGDDRGATAEPGEPDPAPGFTTRASVWYDWTAPSGDETTIDVCTASFLNGVSVYTGSSVGQLTEVAKGVVGNPCQVSFTPTLGTTYRIAVDGLGQTGTFPLALDQGVQHRSLSVRKSGSGSGTVGSSPSGIDCGFTCQHSFADGTTVTLTATAASGSTFAGWSGSGCTGTGTCTVTMSADKIVTATFTRNTHTLTLTPAGSGSGTVSSDPAGIDCGSTCQHAFDEAATVTLTATPAAGSTFTGWSGGCSGAGACHVTMSQARSVTATFTRNTHALTVAKSGSGAGTLSSDPAGIDCGATCQHTYDEGTAVTLTANAASGSTFAGWSGGGCSGTGTCTVTVSADKSVTATFTRNTHALTVTPAGSGSGTVSSDPAGIDCGATCQHTYDEGTAVTLTASAASGSTFAGWSGGGCSGTATCTVTMSAENTVTATFTAESGPPPPPPPPATATEGNDVLTGTAGPDLICGLGGSDTINGLAGNDTLFGDACNVKSKALSAAASAGNDTLNGGDGDDKLYGAAGNDTLNGGKGKDKLFGGRGNDKLNGGPGLNTYSGGTGNDTVNARNGKKETVDCGPGKKDKATVDKKDRTKGCEKVKRAKK